MGVVAKEEGAAGFMQRPAVYINMINLDPEVRKFLLYIVSDTFAEIRKFVLYKQYDRKKVISGLQEICALFDLEFQSNEKTEEKLTDICMYCGKTKNRRSGHFPFHVKCEIEHRKNIGKFKIMKLEDI